MVARNYEIYSECEQDILLFYKRQKKIYMKSMYLCIIIRGLLLASENDIFTRKKYRIFYVCLNTIFLSGQKLYITLMFIK